MLRFGAFIAAMAATAIPAQAQQMDAREARSFVVGKLFTYECFEGTRGAGRIMDNGSVAGTIQFRGNGSTRYAMLPHNTIRVVGERVCASVKGLPFEPCFNIVKTSHNSFRGSLSGMGFAYCDFVRRDRPMVASVERPRSRRGAPLDLQADKEAAATAFPKPIRGDDLPAVDDTPTGATAAVNVESKPAENKPADSKAGENTPVDSKPGENNAAADNQPVEEKPIEVSASAEVTVSPDKPELRPSKD